MIEINPFHSRETKDHFHRFHSKWRDSNNTSYNRMTNYFHTTFKYLLKKTIRWWLLILSILENESNRFFSSMNLLRDYSRTCFWTGMMFVVKNDRSDSNHCVHCHHHGNSSSKNPNILVRKNKMNKFISIFEIISFFLNEWLPQFVVAMHHDRGRENKMAELIESRNTAKRARKGERLFFLLLRDKCRTRLEPCGLWW